MSAADAGQALMARGLVKSYGELVAVDHIDLTVAKGECFALLGPNGAGKTTTMEILEGLQRPDSGSVTILGIDMLANRDQALPRIGVVLQETNLYKRFTVRETLQLFASFYRNPVSIDHIMDQLQIRDKADAKLVQLSGGQKQRVYIGCSLVNNPELLFVDEPTAGLDPQARRLIWDILSEIKRDGRSLLLTTHYMDEAEQLADRIAIIDHGKIIAQNTPEGLIQEFAGDRIIRLRLPDTDDAQAKVLALKTKPGFAQAEYSGNILSLAAPKALSEWISILHTVEDAGLEIDNLTMRRATMEDVFLHLTGRSIRDG